MILQALTAYYEQLLRTGQISAPGWENQFKVSYWLRINAEGQLIDLVDCRQMVPRAKRSARPAGNGGSCPCQTSFRHCCKFSV